MADSIRQDRKPILGCIADDVTGATDLAINLVNGGMQVVQVMGVPDEAILESVGDCDAIVIALKTRSIPAEEAISLSVQSVKVLQQYGVDRFYFKYCSTFDSTAEGNIGPVAEALKSHLKVAQTVFCPAFPRAGRRVFRGHLFVGDCLLSESGMQDHPLNPMTDSNLVRFLSRQTAAAENHNGHVGLIDHEVISLGAAAVIDRLAELKSNGFGNVVTDTCSDSDLRTLANAVSPMPLITGGSGLARFLPDAYRSGGSLRSNETSAALPTVNGRNLIIAGSCSRATNAQVQWMQQHAEIWNIDVPSVISDETKEMQRLKKWAKQHCEGDSARPLLITSSDMPEQVAALQEEYGVEVVAAAIEGFVGRVAADLTSEFGFRRLVLAGGETSGAIVKALGIRALRIGPEICAGVPWTESIGSEDTFALALKSGNFGDVDFFGRALEMLS